VDDHPRTPFASHTHPEVARLRADVVRRAERRRWRAWWWRIVGLAWVAGLLAGLAAHVIARHQGVLL
jgi:hypothetical protein